ncbi:MAG: TolC family protein [Bacteroidetes bacterium]|nr:TolC family protein [Bacteroidota bacterium]
MKRIFFLWITGLALQPGAAQNLQLQDAVNIALKNSLEIGIANNRVEIASNNNHIGVAGGLPVVAGALSDNEQITSINQKLNTGTSISRNNAAANALNANISGSILLYNGGRVTATKKRLAELQAQSKEVLNAQVQNVIADVMTAYYDVVRQQNYIKTIDRSIEASSDQLRLIKIRQLAGLANNADLFQAQIDVNNLQQSKLAQELIVQQSKSELMRLLNLKPDSNIVIQDTIIIDRKIELQTVLAGLEKNADVQAANRQISINELVVKETAAQRYPSVRANAGYTFTRNKSAAGQLLLNQSYGPSVGLSVAIPIYNGSVFRRQQKNATVEVKNANLQKEILIRDYTAQAVKQFQAYVNTVSQLDSARENYKLSEKLLNLTMLRFEYKQATTLEVKNAQQSFEASGYRLVNLTYAAKASEIELKRLSNTLTP